MEGGSLCSLYADFWRLQSIKTKSQVAAVLRYRQIESIQANNSARS